MKHLNLKFVSIIIMIASTSCFQELSTIKTSSRSLGGTGLSSAGALNISETVVSNMTMALVATYGLSQKQAVTLAHGALELLDKKASGAGLSLWERTELMLTGSSFNGNDITQAAPVIMQGMIGAMTKSDASLGDDTSKMKAVKGITTSMFIAIKDNIATLSAEKKKALPGSIAQTAVANLVNGGISTAKISESVNTIMTSTVSTLDDAGYSAKEIISTIAGVTQGGMQGLGNLKESGAISAMQVATMSYNVAKSAIDGLNGAGVTDTTSIKAISITVTSTALSTTMSMISAETDKNAIFDAASKMITSGTMSALGSITTISSADMQTAAQAIVTNAMSTVYAGSSTYGITFDSSIATNMSAGMYDGLAAAGLSATQIAGYADDINNGIQNGLVGTTADAAAFATATEDSFMPSPTIDVVTDITLSAAAVEQVVKLTGITDGGAGGKTLTVSASSDSSDIITNLRVSYTSPASTGTLTFTLGAAANAYGAAIINVTVDDGRSTTISFMVNINPISQPLTVNDFALHTSENVPIYLSDLANNYNSPDGSPLIAIRIESAPSMGQLFRSFDDADWGMDPLTTGSIVTLWEIYNIVYVPNYYFYGQDSFTYSGTNAGSLFSAAATVNITIDFVNQPPMFDYPSDVTMSSYDTNVVVTITGIYEPVQEGKILTITAVSDNLTVVPSPTVSYIYPASTATLTFNPVNNNNGSSANITVTADDGAGGVTSMTFTVYLDDSPPTIHLSTIAASITDMNPIPVTLTSTKALQPFSLSVIMISGVGGTSANLTQISPTVYTFEVTPNTSGNLWIMVQGGTLQDLAGHSAGTGNSLSIAYDADYPSIGNPSLFYNPGYHSIAFRFQNATDNGTPIPNLGYQLYTSTSPTISTIADAMAFGYMEEDTINAGRLVATSLTAGSSYYANVFAYDAMFHFSPYAQTSQIQTLGLQQNWTQLVAGSRHACGLTAQGNNFCWGDNSYGQHGDDTTTTTYEPGLPTDFMGSQFISVAAGSLSSCGLTQDGNVYCWGDNGFGNLGDGSTTSSVAPVAIFDSATHKFVALSAGLNHVCGIDSNGNLFCWGDNSYSQLGNATTDHTRPIQVSGTDKYITFAAGGAHTCGITGTGQVKCWGMNSVGQLGNGATSANQSSPTSISDTFHYKALAAGNNHTCGLTDNDSIRCWGDGTSGQLGNSTFGNLLTPGPVTGGYQFNTLTAGKNHTCGILQQATVAQLTDAAKIFCWGDNTQGQLGVGDNTVRNVPTIAAAGGKYIKVVSGPSANFTCAQAENSAIQCFGDNSYGQLALSNTISTNTPSYFNYSAVPHRQIRSLSKSPAASILPAELPQKGEPIVGAKIVAGSSASALAATRSIPLLGWQQRNFLRK